MRSVIRPALVGLAAVGMTFAGAGAAMADGGWGKGGGHNRSFSVEREIEQKAKQTNIINRSCNGDHSRNDCENENEAEFEAEQNKEFELELGLLPRNGAPQL